MPADNLHRFERIKALKLERLLLRQRIEQLDHQIAALKSQMATPLTADPDAESPACGLRFDSTRVVVVPEGTEQTSGTAGPSSAARLFKPC